MSIEKTDEIDLIGIDNQTGEVKLAIIDDLDWIDIERHLQLLQDKINAYLSFVESEEIYQVYPDAKNRRILIQIIAQYDPPDTAAPFYNSLQEILSEIGCSFTFTHIM